MKIINENKYLQLFCQNKNCGSVLEILSIVENGILGKCKKCNIYFLIGINYLEVKFKDINGKSIDYEEWIK